jgi:O-antigen/teichoic acid export membrane protein
MKKLVLGISSGILFTLVSIGIALLTAPYFLKFLSKEEFGIFYLINNLIIWSGLLNVGLRGSFKLQLAQAIGRNDFTDSLTSTAFFTQCLVAVAVCFFGYGILQISEILFPLSILSSVTSKHVFILLTCSFSFTIISNCLAAILSVYNKDHEVYSTRTILTVLQAILSVIFLHLNSGIVGLAFAAIIVEFIFLCHVYFLVSTKFCLARLKFSLFDPAILKGSIRIGKWFLLGFLAQLLIRHTDLLLIGKLGGIDKITGFLMTAKLYVLATAFLQTILKIITPQLIRFINSEKNIIVTYKINLLFLKIFVGISIIVGSGIFLFNGPFIYWWLGQDYYLGENINILLLFAFLFNSFTMAGRALLLASNKLRSQKISALSEGILHLSLASLFGLAFGLSGVVLGIAISSVLSNFICFAPLIASHKISDENKLDINFIAIYIMLSLIGILFLYLSPWYFGKEIISLGLFLGIFLLLFLREVRWVTLKILRS